MNPNRNAGLHLFSFTLTRRQKFVPKIIRKLLLYPWRFVSGSRCKFPARGLRCVWRHQIMTSVITISRVLAKAAEQSSLCSYLNIVFLERHCLQNSEAPRAWVCNFSTRIEMIRVFCFIDHLPREKQKKLKKEQQMMPFCRCLDTLVSRGKDAQESLCFL